jgi:N-acyl amino acid synthase of PEP-CTERM/exosortase system
MNVSKHSQASRTRPSTELHSAPETDLAEVYERYFDVIPADSQELLDEALRLRYQVYCVEHAFENPLEHPDGREIDRYDRHSVHSLLIHKPTKAVVGTVRLILPSNEPLPITQVCQDVALARGLAFPTTTAAEISRFAISKSFRRRVEDQHGIDAALVDQATIDDPLNRRVIPHMALGLMKAVVQMSVAHGMTHLCAVMDPALLRLLARLGIRFDPLGPLVNYHGRRQPCHRRIATILAGLRADRPDAWDVITDRGTLAERAGP